MTKSFQFFVCHSACYARPFQNRMQDLPTTATTSTVNEDKHALTRSSLSVYVLFLTNLMKNKKKTKTICLELRLQATSSTRTKVKTTSRRWKELSAKMNLLIKNMKSNKGNGQNTPSSKYPSVRIPKTSEYPKRQNTQDVRIPRRQPSGAYFSLHHIYDTIVWWPLHHNPTAPFSFII